MGFHATSPMPLKGDLSAKNRVWGFFGDGSETHRENRPQTLQPRQANPPVTTRTASGRSYWPSRDPIGENGGFNLYGMVRNGAVNFWDYLGLEIVHTGNVTDAAKDRLNQALKELAKSPLGKKLVCWALHKDTRLEINWDKKKGPAAGGATDENFDRVPDRGLIRLNSGAPSFVPAGIANELGDEMPQGNAATQGAVVLAHELGHAIPDIDLGEGSTVGLIENKVRNDLKVPERKTYHGEKIEIDPDEKVDFEKFKKKMSKCDCEKLLKQIK